MSHEPEPKSDSDLARKIESEWLSACNYLSEYHEEWADNYLFLYKFDHYEDEHANTRDRRRVKPRGRQSASKHRHKLAQIMRQSFYLTTRAVDQMTDPNTAAAVRWWLEFEVNDPQKLFKRKLRRAYSLAMGAGAGALGLSCRYDLGPFPVIMPYLMDPRCLTWTPGFSDPDDCETPSVYIEDQYPPEQIEAMKDFGWKNTKDTRPDVPGQSGRDGRSFDRLQPITQNGHAGPAPGYIGEQSLVRVVRKYSRFDQTRKKKNAETNRELPPEEHYMACIECGFQDRTQDGRMLPPTAGPCPGCGNVLFRVEVEVPIESMLAYPQGHRLTITCPSDHRVFYDGPWPHSINGRPPRNIPAALFRGYDVPMEPWGSSDTAWDWSYQVIANSVMRRGWEQMSRAGGVIITSGQLYGADGKSPFEFSDRPVTLARWKGAGEPQVRFFQPEGLPRDFVPFKQAVDSDFHSDMGYGDVSLSKEQMKGVNVGTIQEARASGEIPVDDQAEQFRETLTPFIGTWYDMKRAVMTERQVVRIRGPQGVDELAAMRGEDLPNVDVIVGAQPTWDAFDSERAEQVQRLLAAPPEAVQLLAEAGNIPPEYAQKVLEVAEQVRANAPPPEDVPPSVRNRMNGAPGAARAPQRNGARP